MWSPTTTTTSTTHRVGWAGWSWSLLFLVGSLVFPILVHAGGKSVAFLPSSSSPRMPEVVVDNKVDQVNNELKKRLLETTSLCCSSTSTSHSVETSATLRGEPENHASCHDAPESDEEEEREDEEEEEVSEVSESEEDNEEDKGRTELESKCSHHNLSNCRLCLFFHGPEQSWNAYEMVEALNHWLKDDSVKKSDLQRMMASKHVYFTLLRYCQSEKCADDLLEQLKDLTIFMAKLFLQSYEEILQTFTEMNDYVDLRTPLIKDEDLVSLSAFTTTSLIKLNDFLKVISPPWVHDSEHRDLFIKLGHVSKQVIGKFVLSIHRFVEPIIMESRYFIIAGERVKQSRGSSKKKKKFKSKDETLLQSLWERWENGCVLAREFSTGFVLLPFKLDLTSKLLDPLGLINGEACSKHSLLGLHRA